MAGSFYRQFDDLRYLARYPEVRKLLSSGDCGSAEEHWRTTDGDFQPYWWSPVPDGRPVRVCLLTPGLGRGGAEKWVEMLALHSDPARVDVRSILMIGQEPGICAEFGESLGGRVPIHTQYPDTMLPSPGSGFAVRHPTMEDAVTAALQGVDVVLAWGVRELEKYVDRFSGRVVYCSHGSAPHAIEALQEAAASASHLTAVSAAAAGETGATVIYNGVDLDRVLSSRSRQEIRDGWGFAQESRCGLVPLRLAGYVGRAGREKDAMAVIRAVSQLPSQYQAVIAGEFPQKFQETANRLLPGRVLFLGHVSAIGDVLTGLDVLVSASVSEAHSLSLCEAWAAGLPTVSTPVGAVPELECQYGTLTFGVPAEPTSHELAAAVRDAVQNPNDPRVRRAEFLATRLFSREAFIRRWENFLCSICRENPGLGQTPETGDPEIVHIVPPCQADIVRPQPRVFYEWGYLRVNPEVSSLISKDGECRSACEHWLRIGRKEGLQPSYVDMQDFDEDAYLNQYPSVRDSLESGQFRSASEHFMQKGNREKKRFFSLGELL